VSCLVVLTWLDQDLLSSRRNHASWDACRFRQIFLATLPEVVAAIVSSFNKTLLLKVYAHLFFHHFCTICFNCFDEHRFVQDSSFWDASFVKQIRTPYRILTIWSHVAQLIRHCWGLYATFLFRGLRQGKKKKKQISREFQHYQFF